MSNFIKKVHISNLFDSVDVNWDLKNVNVLVGRNGAGKSTILRLINSTLINKPSDELNLCDKIVVELSDGQKIVNSSFRNYLKNKDIESLLSFSILEDQAKDSVSRHPLAATFDEETKDHIAKDLKKTLVKILIENFPKDEYQPIIDVEFISTVNMSANSINKIESSDGNTLTILDFEIKKEMHRLLKYNNKNLILNLISALNNIFIETGKEVYFDEQESALLAVLRNKKYIPIERLSSGERQIIYIFLKAVNASVNNSIILMDEPEISLHLSWQEVLISEIRKINENSQIIIVTHSPAIIMDGWMDSFIDIKDIIKENKNV